MYCILVIHKIHFRLSWLSLSSLIPVDILRLDFNIRKESKFTCKSKNGVIPVKLKILIHTSVFLVNDSQNVPEGPIFFQTVFCFIG